MNRFDVPAESFQLRSSVQTATNSLGESERERERENENENESERNRERAVTLAR